MPSKWLRFLLIGLVLAAPAVAIGSPFTIIVSGTVSSVEDPSSSLDPSVVVGASYSASFTLDSTGVDNRSDDNSIGFFSPRFDPFGATGQIGSLSLVDNGAGLGLQDNVPFLDQGVITMRDILSLQFRDVTIPGVPCVSDGLLGGACQTFAIHLTDPTASALSSDQIPGLFPSLSAWSATTMTMGMLHLPVSHSQFLRVRGTVEQFTVVPEPGSAVLIGFGLAGLATRWRPRRRL